MNVRFARVLVPGLVLLGGASASDYLTSEFVTDIEGLDNLKGFVETNNRSFVNFYTPNCEWCRATAPEFHAAAKLASQWNTSLTVKFAQVNVLTNQDIVARMALKKFPTMWLFVDDYRREYYGAKTKESFLHWLNRFIRPALTIVSSAEEARSLTGPDIATYMLEVDSSENQYFKMWEGLATKNREMGFFMARIDPKVSEPRVFVLRVGDDDVVTNDLEQERLIKFMIAEATPLFGELTFFNDHMFGLRSDKYFIFCGTSDDYESVRSEISKASRQNRLEYNFVWMNIDNPSFEARARRSFGFRDYPAAVLVVNRDDRYIFGQDNIPSQDYSAKAIDEFLRRFEQGGARKYLASEPIPTQEESLLKLVGANFHDEVFRTDKKDILILFHAVYCTVCEETLKVFEQLAKVMGPSKDILIAKYDHSKNEIEEDGFFGNKLPAVFFVRGDTQKVYTLDKELPDLEDLLTFIYQHASKQLLLQRDEL